MLHMVERMNAETELARQKKADQAQEAAAIVEKLQQVDEAWPGTTFRKKRLSIKLGEWTHTPNVDSRVAPRTSSGIIALHPDGHISDHGYSGAPHAEDLERIRQVAERHGLA